MHGRTGFVRKAWPTAELGVADLAIEPVIPASVGLPCCPLLFLKKAVSKKDQNWDVEEIVHIDMGYSKKEVVPGNLRDPEKNVEGHKLEVLPTVEAMICSVISLF